jgi:hypothetical protein
LFGFVIFVLLILFSSSSSSSQKTIEESELEPVVAFELGEYLLHFESNYDEALQLLTFAKETFNLKQQSKTNSLEYFPLNHPLNFTFLQFLTLYHKKVKNLLIS